MFLLVFLIFFGLMMLIDMVEQIGRFDDPDQPSASSPDLPRSRCPKACTASCR